MAYRESLDALRERYLLLIALRDELDASIDAAAEPLGDLYARRGSVTLELEDVASRIDLATRAPEPTLDQRPRRKAGSLGRDALLALAVGGLIGIGVASQSSSPPPRADVMQTEQCDI